MYEKNADIMDSLRNAKNSVADGAMSLLQKIRGSSANDGVSALPPEAQQVIGDGVAALPESARKTVESLRGQPMENLAEKATKALGEGGRKLKDSAASGLAYVPGVGGSLDGFFNPIPGRGRLVSAMGEGQMASRFGASSGLLGGIGGATVGTGGALLALLLSKGKLNPRASLALGLGGPLGGAAAGGLVGNSIGTHAGANLFREMAAKEGAFTPPLTGNQEEIDVNDNGKIEAADLAALRKGKKLSKDKTKFAEWPTQPVFTAGMPLPEKKPNVYAGKPPAKKADTAGIQQAAQDKLASQDNCSPSRSAAGDSKGVKYKQQNEDHATGTAAFDSLDKYLRMAKKAGLNDFQSNFFGRLIQEGRNEHEMYAAIKQAGDQFGYKVGKELNRGLEKLSNWGKGLMMGAGALGLGGALGGAGYAAAKMPRAVQAGAKQGMQQGVENVGNNAINSAGNFMNNAIGNPMQAVMSRAPATGGNPFQNVLNAGMQHFGNMMTGAGAGVGGASGVGMQHLRNMANGAQNMVRANGLGGGFTGNGMGKQSSEKQAVNWAGMARAAANYLGTGLARPGAAVKSVYDAAKNSAGAAGPSMPSISKGIKGVLNDKTMRSQMYTGAGTGATNPFTGMFTPSDDPNAGWGDYAARVGGSALAGAGAGLLGGKGVQDVMKRMYAGSLAGSTADLGAGAFGIDTGGLGGKAGFLGAGISPAKMPKFLGQAANRFAGGTDDIIRTGRTGNVFTVPGRQGDTVTALNKLDPFSLIGNGYTKFVKPNVRPALDAMKNNRGLTAGIGLGTAGIGTGAYIGNKAVNGINDASERMNAQMNMLRNETHNNLSGIRQDLGGGMGGIGQFFEENKHWLMPALLAGGGALAGGAIGGGQGAALGGLSLPALYMMHQNGMFGGGKANPLHAPEATTHRPDYAQQNQQYEREQADKQIAARTRDPRLASPTAPKTAGDRAVRLMRHFAKN